MRFSFFSLVIATLIIPFSLQAGQHPNMFINQQEINAVKVKLGSEPWKSAYSQMISAANKALSISPKSVVDNGAGYGANGNVHFFSTDGTGAVGDFKAAIDMNNAIVALGLAYAFTSQGKYADKAIALLYHWALNPSTFMYPLNVNYSPHTPGGTKQWAIEIMTTIPGMLYGADLIWDYSGWNAKTKEDFRIWGLKFGMSAMGQQDYYNNGLNWCILLIMSAAVLTENDDMLTHAVNRWKNTFGGELNSSHMDGQMNLDGSLISEIVRPWGIGYGNYAMQAMAQAAEIARHQGYDLYNYKLPDGRGIEKGADYMAGPTANPATWPHSNTPAYAGQHSGYFEYLYQWKQKSTYLNAVKRWGRPAEEDWINRQVTLTHGAGAYPWKVYTNGSTGITINVIKPTLETVINPDCSYDLLGRLIVPGKRTGIYFKKSNNAVKALFINTHNN